MFLVVWSVVAPHLRSVGVQTMFKLTLRGQLVIERLSYLKKLFLWTSKIYLSIHPSIQQSIYLSRFMIGQEMGQLSAIYLLFIYLSIYLYMYLSRVMIGQFLRGDGVVVSHFVFYLSINLSIHVPIQGHDWSVSTWRRGSCQPFCFLSINQSIYTCTYPGS